MGLYVGGKIGPVGYSKSLSGGRVREPVGGSHKILGFFGLILFYTLWIPCLFGGLYLLGRILMWLGVGS